MIFPMIPSQSTLRAHSVGYKWVTHRGNRTRAHVKLRLIQTDCDILQERFAVRCPREGGALHNDGGWCACFQLHTIHGHVYIVNLLVAPEPLFFPLFQQQERFYPLE